MKGNGKKEPDPEKKRGLDWKVVETLKSDSVFGEIRVATRPDGRVMQSLRFYRETPTGNPTQFFHPQDLDNLAAVIADAKQRVR